LIVIYYYYYYYYYLRTVLLIMWTSETGNWITVSAGVTLWWETLNTRQRLIHNTGYSCWYHISSSVIRMDHNNYNYLTEFRRRGSKISVVNVSYTRAAVIHWDCSLRARHNDMKTSYITIMCEHGYCSLPRYCV